MIGPGRTESSGMNFRFCNFALLTSVRDDFNVRDYSRQDLFIETGYESELITTINLINSEKGFKNSF